MRVRVLRLRQGASLPLYSTPGSAGADLSACLEEPLTIPPGGIATIPTGLAIEIPSGHAGAICSRSGLASKHGIVVLNSPGIIDSDFRGECMIILMNHSVDLFRLEHGSRVAQLVVFAYFKLDFFTSQGLSSSARGDKGLGSSGI
ncbi:MAG: dUTP diphosphatase [Holosporales bacterium]|nr:dUTP diphosphatase [Holosporales bacterium]